MLTEDESDFCDELESVTWTAASGTAEVVPCIVDRDFPNQEDLSRGGEFAVAQLLLHTSRGTPTATDRFVFDGCTWTPGPEGCHRAGSFWQINLRREP